MNTKGGPYMIFSYLYTELKYAKVTKLWAQANAKYITKNLNEAEPVEFLIEGSFPSIKI
jgi:hypothetical protein